MVTALAQTLHGYDRGHRLLARGGDVSEDELAVLDRLSDLSGYLPGGLTFDHYYSGFPCGRYYAFACTWLDTAARRGGTVLTHTLLVPLGHAVRTSDLFGAASLHRRPLSAEDTEPYTHAPAELPEPGVAVSAPPHARAALALYVGQHDRPILWMDDAQPIETVRYLWHLSWPKLRRRFAFCTLALQERSLEGRVFDFLGLPPEAQGSFHKYSGSATWWRQGELAHPALLELPVIVAIEQSGSSWIGARLERCRALDLPDPKRAADLWALHRLLEVRDASRERLTAARAHVDLLARLWPSLPAEHPEWRHALDALIATQPQAALAPRPLWELGYLLDRPQLWLLMDRDQAFAQRVDAVLSAELGRRLCEAEPAGAELPALLDIVRERPLRGAVYRAVAAAVGGGGRELARTLLRASAVKYDAELAHACLQPLSPQERMELLVGEQGILREPGHAGERVWLAHGATDLAVELGELLLAFTIWEILGEPAMGLERATQATSQAGPEAMQRVLQRVEPAMRLDWSVRRTEAALLDMATRHGAEAARELGLAVRELALRCSGGPNGARVFAHACVSRPESELTPILNDWPELAWNIMILGLRDEEVAPALVRAALRALPAERLWGAESREMLAAGGAGARHLTAHLGPMLLQVIAVGGIEPGDGATWLRTAPVEEWLRSTGSWAIERALERPGSTWLHAFIVTVQQAISSGEEAPPWLLMPLYVLLRQAEHPAMKQAASALLDLLSEPAFRAALVLRAEVLLAVRRTEYGNPRLVVAVFHDTYAGVLSDHEALQSVSWPGGWGWDRGKKLRHWLIDTWAERHWPAESLLMCLDRDADLAREVFRRARKHSHASGMWKLISELDSVSANYPFLNEIWHETNPGEWW
jgi:GTPase-associated protein 1, N-terminal domain type 1